MRARLNHIIYIFLGLFGVQAPAANAETFLCFDDAALAGEVTLKGREGCIDVFSFQWGLGSPPGGQPSFSEVTMTKNMDISSPAIVAKISSTKNAGDADVFIHTSCGPDCLGDLVFEMNLTAVFITSLSDSSGGSPPLTESLSLGGYSQLTYCYTPTGGSQVCETVTPP